MNLEALKVKKGPLCLSADVTKSSELLRLADELGPSISILKTHIDIIEDFSYTLIEKLLELKLKHDFLLFEDRKFADIGSTVQKQYAKGIYKIASFADIVNVHPLPGPGVIEGLIKENNQVKCLIVAEMSSKGNLIGPDYTLKSIEMAKAYRENVIGFISQTPLAEGFLTLTPGIHLDIKGDSLGQSYRTPQEALNQGSDFIIVGRAIIDSKNRVEEAKRYCYSPDLCRAH
ncbi:MAG: orotidine-5'-phosphate decarboxylase [Parachlamydiaceae bacterium]